MLDSDDEFIVRVHVGGDEAAGPESEAEQGNKHDSEAADSPAALVEDTAILATPSPAKPTGMRIKRKLNLGEKLKLQNKRLAKLNKVSKAVGNKMEKLSKQALQLGHCPGATHVTQNHTILVTWPSVCSSVPRDLAKAIDLKTLRIHSLTS